MAVLKRYRINNPSRVFNIDECGMSFDRMSARSLRRGVAHAADGKSLDISCLRTKGKLNHVTLMAVIAAEGLHSRRCVPGQAAILPGPRKRLDPDCTRFSSAVLRVSSRPGRRG